MVRRRTFLPGCVGAHTYAASLHAIRGALLPSGPGSCVMRPLMWTAALCLTSFGSFFCVRWHQCRLASRSRQSLRALVCAPPFPSLKGQWRRRRVKPLRYLPNNPFPHNGLFASSVSCLRPHLSAGLSESVRSVGCQMCFPEKVFSCHVSGAVIPDQC